MVNGLPVTLEDERPEVTSSSQPGEVDDPPDEVSIAVEDEPIHFEIHYLGPENASL